MKKELKVDSVEVKDFKGKPTVFLNFKSDEILDGEFVFVDVPNKNNENMSSTYYFYVEKKPDILCFKNVYENTAYEIHDGTKSFSNNRLDEIDLFKNAKIYLVVGRDSILKMQNHVGVKNF